MRKGVTLIEVVVTSSLIMILVFLVSSLFIREFKNYTFYMELHKEELNINEALNFIEIEIKFLKGEVTVDNNKIIIKYTNKKDNIISKKVIERVNKRLRIDTDKDNDGYFEGHNNILSYDHPIKDFNVILKNKIMYIEIENMKGNKYKKCLKV